MNENVKYFFITTTMNLFLNEIYKIYKILCKDFNNAHNNNKLKHLRALNYVLSLGGHLRGHFMISFNQKGTCQELHVCPIVRALAPYIPPNIPLCITALTSNWRDNHRKLQVVRAP